ncbi:MAG TPA: response regulator [Burkholderiales bacterium]|nr:response regulator [Burkholderiales bacterium]
MRTDSASTRPDGARPFVAGHGAVPRVLVAHTSKSLRQLVKLQLACAGYEVIVAEDAIDAGRQVLRQPPDLIVLDIEMPALDGLEFLRSDDGLPLIPVIFLTARQEALERATRLGAAACLTTPLATSRLLETVARCLAAQSEARAGYRLLDRGDA